MPRYALIQRLLHWAIALMVLAALAIGLIFWLYGGFGGTKNAFGGPLTGAFYKYHKTLGVLILGFMLIRIVVKISLGKPEYSVPLGRFESIASNATHGLLYLLIPVMAVLGWLGTGAGGFPVQFFEWNLPKILSKDKELGEVLMNLHAICGWGILALVLAHVGGALKHWLVTRDGVMGRMGFF